MNVNVSGTFGGEILNSAITKFEQPGMPGFDCLRSWGIRRVALSLRQESQIVQRRTQDKNGTYAEDSYE